MLHLRNNHLSKASSDIMNA